MTLLRCTNEIGGKCTRQMILLNSICASLSPAKCLSEKEYIWRISNLGFCLVMFNVILKYPRIFEKLLPFFHSCSRRLLLVEMILVQLWKNMPRKKDCWLNIGKCWCQSVSWRMEQSVHRCCSFIWTWDCFGRQFIVLCNRNRWSAVTTLFSLQWMVKEKEMRI